MAQRSDRKFVSSGSIGFRIACTMGHNDHTIQFDSEFPPDAGKHTRSGFEPDDKWLQGAEPEIRLALMRTWFATRFWDPANDTPYSSEEGGYLFIHGGPYDAGEELRERFGHLCSDCEIQSVIDELESDGVIEWAPVHTEPDYDAVFEFEPNRRSDPFQFFEQRLNEVDALASAEIDHERRPLLRQLMYSSLIAALEAYLADTMSYWVSVDQRVFRRFVSSCEEFQHQKLTLAQIFERMDALEDEVERYLQQLVWHRLDKVVPILADSLGIKKLPIAQLMSHILVRHDIIHRGGRTKDGHGVNVSDAKLKELRGDVVSFVNEIETELSRVFPIDVSGLTGKDDF